MGAGTVHVIGAGLSGLAAALWLVRAGRRVSVYEAAGQAGGRCRSLFDSGLGRRIDNGNHLVLSGNRAVADYLAAIGGEDGLTGPERAAYPFIDLAGGERWTVRPGRGAVPWWVLSARRRIPGTRPADYLSAWRLARARPEATVADCLNDGTALFRRFWEPLTVAVLNAHPAEAAAALLWPVVRETFARGEAACRPRIARDGLSECFVAPALRRLAEAGGEVRFRSRLQGVDYAGERAERLHFAGGETVAVPPGEEVVLAVPPSAAAQLAPGVTTPRGQRAIVNGHFRLATRRRQPALIGLIGGLGQWLFVRGDVASVTISAADALLAESGESLARRMWPEVVLALGLADATLPAFRIIKEKRATFAQTPDNLHRRPGTRSPWNNLMLAGDWTDTGLPATIEGSLLSGRRAAEAVLASRANT